MSWWHDFCVQFKDNETSYGLKCQLNCKPVVTLHVNFRCTVTTALQDSSVCVNVGLNCLYQIDLFLHPCKQKIVCQFSVCTDARKDQSDTDNSGVLLLTRCMARLLCWRWQGICVTFARLLCYPWIVFICSCHWIVRWTWIVCIRLCFSFIRSNRKLCSVCMNVGKCKLIQTIQVYCWIITLQILCKRQGTPDSVVPCHEFVVIFRPLRLQ